jgi:hypothetical protein
MFVADSLFVTVMVRVNGQFLPMVIAEGTSVMRNDFHVHKFGVRLAGGIVR